MIEELGAKSYEIETIKVSCTKETFEEIVLFDETLYSWQEPWLEFSEEDTIEMIKISCTEQKFRELLDIDINEGNRPYIEFASTDAGPETGRVVHASITGRDMDFPPCFEEKDKIPGNNFLRSRKIEEINCETCLAFIDMKLPFKIAPADQVPLVHHRQVNRSNHPLCANRGQIDLGVEEFVLEDEDNPVTCERCKELEKQRLLKDEAIRKELEEMLGEDWDG